MWCILVERDHDCTFLMSICCSGTRPCKYKYLNGPRRECGHSLEFVRLFVSLIQSNEYTQKCDLVCVFVCACCVCVCVVSLTLIYLAGYPSAWLCCIHRHSKTHTHTHTHTHTRTHARTHTHTHTRTHTNTHTQWDNDKIIWLLNRWNLISKKHKLHVARTWIKLKLIFAHSLKTVRAVVLHLVTVHVQDFLVLSTSKIWNCC
jgi:hypothetical protein